MSKEILRKYLEIKSIKDLKESEYPGKKYTLNLIDKKNFQLNKFLYKQIGKKYRWIDRLEWTDQKWINYVNQIKIFSLLFLKKKKI